MPDTFMPSFLAFNKISCVDIYCSDVFIIKFSLGKYLEFVSKIGLILSITFLDTLAAFHPASVHPKVLYGW